MPSAPPGEHHGLLHSFRVVRREGLVALAVVLRSAIVEGGIDTWGCSCCGTSSGEPGRGAAAYVLGQGVATASRALLGPVAGRFGAARGIAVGSGLAAFGLVLIGVAPAVGAAVGLTLAATGVSVCWPMLLAYVPQGRARPAGIVSGVTATGYIGFVVGPVVIGAFAEVVGLRAAVLVLAADRRRRGDRPHPGHPLPAAEAERFDGQGPAMTYCTAARVSRTGVISSSITRRCAGWSR